MDTPTRALVRRQPPPIGLRPARFEDVPEMLRLIGRAVAHGCSEHYSPAQRAAVYASYASTLFVDALAAFDTIAAELDGRLIGFAQVDPARGRLRALFVDAESQGRGVGRALLEAAEARAVRRGCVRLHGAMSLNAVPFYARAGFRELGEPEPLTTTEARVPVPIVRMEKNLREQVSAATEPRSTMFVSYPHRFPYEP